MIFLTGDTHSNEMGEMRRFTSRNFPQGKELTKNDYVIILGDFGFIWKQEGFSKQELHWMKWINNKSWTTLFLDGNHENFDRLLSDEFPVKDMFNNQVKEVMSSIFYLQRGRCYEIENFKFFVMGGGISIDKEYRMPHVGWWPQEEPTFSEWNFALENARKVRSVDYILTHEVPNSVYKELDYYPKLPNSVSDGVTALTEVLSYKKGFSGHHHFDHFFEKQKWQILYNKIIQIS